MHKDERVGVSMFYLFFSFFILVGHVKQQNHSFCVCVCLSIYNYMYTCMHTHIFSCGECE